MKKCSNCGAQVADTAEICPVCGGIATAPGKASGGRETRAETVSRQEMPLPEQTVQYQTVYVPQPVAARPDGKGKAIVSFVLGISGLVISVLAPTLDGIPAVFGLLICIVGIVFGVKARNRLPVGVSGRGIATAGLTFSIIGAVISGLITLAVVCIVVGVFALCATTPTAYVDYVSILLPLIF